ncbi:hypothetical protein [Pedobacter rhodius]|uniref:Uncharacterized protein n=1 Tax=Pedobacter rhodius TaxID=3004098 RepID=A0ABT4KX40_9SPHI|nr:hypothetical protein [Pedobacter sp. SJ11]MCZ4223503.1 hypothetical protein [Pedobacter sp. SJ11]
MNFYRVSKEDFTSLEKEIRISLHSRDLHRKASVIYNNPDMFSEVKRAWAVWLTSSQSFSSQLGSKLIINGKNVAINIKIIHVH